MLERNKKRKPLEGKKKHNMFEEQNILVSELFIKKIIERCWGELYDVNDTSKFKD